MTAPDGSKSGSAREYRRNASGRLVLDADVSRHERKDASGALIVQTVEKKADVNGRLVPQTETTQRIVSKSETEKVVTSEIKSYDHVDARFQVTSTEVATIKSDGDTTLIDREVREHTRTGMEVTARETTRETKTGDGSVNRETVMYGRSLHSKSVGTVTADDLKPQRKMVEREERKSDGTVVTKREVFRRDVNGEWVPVTFSVGGANDLINWPLD